MEFLKQGHQREVEGKELLAPVEPTPRESGNYAYDVHRFADDTNLWFVYVRPAWFSSEGGDNHLLQSPNRKVCE
jgi:quinol monooxygenase YgiN